MKRIVCLLIFTTFIILSCTSTPSSNSENPTESPTSKTTEEETPSIPENIEESEPQLTEEITLSENDISTETTESTEPEVKLPKYTLRKPSGKPIQLSESWGYVMRGREDEFNSSMPLTDICYFGADISCYGELMDVPPRSKLKLVKNQRCHLVIACDSRGSVHQALNPAFPTRKKILQDIVKAAGPYDGVQLDLEYIPIRDRKHFITFIGDLRYLLKGKTLSVCVPARFKLLREDMYPYNEIALYCDRVFVMAYDEHWSTSRPGAIASVEWCKKVANYAVQAIPAKKLVMGIPFYGRTWASEPTASGWYFSGINRLMTEHDVEEVIYENDVPTVRYTANVDITAYFNDAYSSVELCRMYQSLGIKKLGYWRIGQEDPEFWNWVEIRK